jgi:hypothetical protein
MQGNHFPEMVEKDWKVIPFARPDGGNNAGKESKRQKS